MKKRMMIAALVFFVLGFAVQHTSAQAPAQAKKLRFGGVLPPPEVSMVSEMAKTWQEEVTKRTKGAITFESFWGAALGAAAEHVELIGKGTIQAGNTQLWYTPGKFPLADFEYVFPFAPTDYELVSRAMIKIRSEFPQLTEEQVGRVISAVRGAFAHPT